MSSTTPLPRRRPGRTRAATALAAAGALIMSAGVIGLIASPASADHNGKPGNHGKPANPGGPKPSGGPHATPPGQDKVGICHRTASATNRYVYIEVPREEANGHITGASKQHNQVIMWPAGSTWQGQSKSGPVLDYYANGPADCEDRTTTTTTTTTTTGGSGLQDLSPAVAFTDADCDTLGEEDWDGTLEAFVDYEETGEVGPGETVTVEAMIEPSYAGTYEFAPGAQTEFTHTFDDVTLEDCVQGEETIVPKPKPEKPEKPKPTVKGVEVVVPPAAPPAAAPTAVAAGIGGTTTGPLQTIAQMLVAGGMLLLMAGAWIGLGRRESGTHEA